MVDRAEVKEVIEGHIIQVVLSEKKMINGDRYKKLMSASNKIEHKSYICKWQTEL